MTKKDIKLTLSSINGKNVYVESYISRTLARKIETIIEEQGGVIVAPYTERKTKIVQETPL